MSITLHATDKFPAGQSVSAYAMPGQLPPADGLALPGWAGAALATATVAADGSLTFGGLADGASFVAYASVSSTNRYVMFSTQPLVPTSADLSRLAGIGGTPVSCVRRVFTETDGAGVYTGSVQVPAGASIVNIIVNGVALWAATTSATLKVGDVADDDGFFTAVNLKATDLLAGESLSLDFAGGKQGAYVANSQVSPRYSATDRIVSGVVTTVGAAGSTGRTGMTVLYTLPIAADSAQATKA